MSRTDDANGYAALMDELADSITRLDDEDLYDEVRADGEDPAAIADETRQYLHKIIKSYKQRHLRQAAIEYRRRITEISTLWIDLPETPDERRTLLASLFANHPTIRDAYLTIQHREFKDLSDRDVESCLAQLAALGVTPRDRR